MSAIAATVFYAVHIRLQGCEPLQLGIAVRSQHAQCEVVDAGLRGRISRCGVVGLAGCGMQRAREHLKRDFYRFFVYC